MQYTLTVQTKSGAFVAVFDSYKGAEYELGKMIKGGALKIGSEATIDSPENEEGVYKRDRYRITVWTSNPAGFFEGGRGVFVAELLPSVTMHTA